MRELNSLELQNVSFLTVNDVPFGLLEVTATGLEKSILDATQPFRDFLQVSEIHDFDRQPQGRDFKVVLPASALVAGQGARSSRASLYRPQTKKGDPRVWFRGLKALIAPNEILGIIWAGDQFWLTNLSTIDVEAVALVPGSYKEIIGPFVSAKSSAVKSLLALLRGVAGKGFIAAPVRGATAVGRLLETELGIAINSRREPDFQGIEIKSSRSSKNRTTLLAKTPAWGESAYKSSRELLAAFGYDRDGKRKLSCTVSGIVRNSQGLQLEVDERNDRLHVVHGAQGARVVEWDMEVLRDSLAAKHNETFWVKAESRLINGWEYLRFIEVQHTQKAIISQLPALLADGKVTVDFLIRENGDKGYLFKILPKNLNLLFPPAVKYELPIVDLISG